MGFTELIAQIKKVEQKVKEELQPTKILRPCRVALYLIARPDFSGFSLLARKNKLKLLATFYYKTKLAVVVCSLDTQFNIKNRLINAGECIFEYLVENSTDLISKVRHSTDFPNTHLKNSTLVKLREVR